MPLRVIDTGEIWKGERVRGVLYTQGIETKFSDEELLRAGFERVPAEEPIVQPEEVPQTNQDFELINNQPTQPDWSDAYNAETEEI